MTFAAAVMAVYGITVALVFSPAAAADDTCFLQAEQNSRLAAEAFSRCRKYIDGWLAHADPQTGLIPRNLNDRYWNGRDAAADNYPFMVLTAAMTDRPLLEGRLLDMLRTETRLTCRVDRLPDDFLFSKQAWRRESRRSRRHDLRRRRIREGRPAPHHRMDGPQPVVGADDRHHRRHLEERRPSKRPSARFPTLNFEVNGDLLQACSRLFWFTGDRKYLDWAIRLGDYYLLGSNHPTRDMDSLTLGDHSCEVINGLSELYLAVSHAVLPEKREVYRKPHPRTLRPHPRRSASTSTA